MNEEIYFSDPDIFSKISKILEKNGVEETIVEAMFKEQSFISIIFHLIKEIAKQTISEKNFCLSLKNQVGVSEEISANILTDIKREILPTAEKIIVGTHPQEKKITVGSIDNIKNYPEISSKLPSVPNRFTEKKFKVVKAIKATTVSKESQKISKESDSYREPLE